MKKIALGALVLVVGLTVGWSLQKPTSAPTNQPIAPATKNLTFGAQLSLVSGTVEIKQNQASKWERAEVGANLQEGSSVEVRGEGKAIISIDDGSAIRLNTDSAVTLTKLSDEVRITNEKGNVYTRVVKADRKFIVLADSVSYESLGTAFETINKEDEKGVKVYESQVKVLGTSEDGQEVLVGAGKKYYVVKKSDTTIVKKVTDLEAKELKEKFAQWNTEEDLKNFKDKMGVLIAAEEQKEAEETIAAEENTASGIVLTAVKTNEGVKLSWTVKDVDTSAGFKVVKGEAANPVFPGNDYQYLTNPGTRSYVWHVDAGKSYYFRVCQYSDNGCKAYSNNVKVAASDVETKELEVEGNISLTAKASGNELTWTVNGYSKDGFKVVWSKQSGPTFPLRHNLDQYTYIENPSGRSATMEAFDGPGVYYARVCEYLYSVGCGTYSNQVQVNLQ